MNIKGSVALVTGANRGLGAAFVKALLASGAQKVYAAARDPSTVTAQEGVVPVCLDVTSPEQIESLAQEISDVNLVINNAGLAGFSSILDPSSIEQLKNEFEVNVVGSLRVTQAFAPQLGVNQPSAVVNVISVLSWMSTPPLATYGVSKSAAWSLSNALRQELGKQSTHVLSLHMGLVDTDMASAMDGNKASPHDIARITLDALAAGECEVLADDSAKQVHAGLTASPPLYL